MNITEPESAPTAKPRHELAVVVVPLLKGVLYQEENPTAWSAMSPCSASI